MFNDHIKVIARPYQEEMRERGLENIFAKKHRGTLCVAPMGCGKCHGKGTRVIMFDGGMKKVEDVKIGDRLMGVDSMPRTVLSVTHGRGKLFKVVPAKGDPYIVNEHHILSLKATRGAALTKKSKYHAGAVINISVSDWLCQKNWFKNVMKGYRVAVDFSWKPVELDPYFLGLWLGDGSEKSPVVTAADSEIVRYLYQFAESLGLTVNVVRKKNNKASNYYLSGGKPGNSKACENPLTGMLRSIGVYGCKFIPKKYMCNSRSVRLGVLAGLLDSDGSLAGSSGYDFVSKYGVIANGVAYLARSLGFAAYVSKCRKKCYNNGVVGDYFRVSISGDTEIIPCKVVRKKATKRMQKKDVLMTAIKVEPHGTGDYYGFSIDGDHLYLLEDFTVTHNSLAMALTAIKASHHGGVLILAHFKKLVDQNQEAVQRLGHRCYIYTGGHKDVIWSDVRDNGAAVSATVQSIVMALHKIDPSTFKLILIDEGHHATLGSDYHKVAQYFSAPVILYSATPERADGKSLVGEKALCESVAYNGQIRDFVRDGWILEPRIRYEEVEKMNWSVIDDDSSPITEEQAARVWEANEAHFASVKPMLESVGDMPMIGFAPTVKLAKLWAEMVNDDRPGKAEYVASFKPGDYTSAKLEFGMTERSLIESQYESGQLQYLFNQGVYLEGADLVRAQVAVMYILTTSKSKYVQAAGRPLRPCNGPDGVSILRGLETAPASTRLARIAASEKPYAVILDYAGSSGPNKLAHPANLFESAENPIDPKVMERVKKDIAERMARGERDVSLEEVIHEQEDAYKKFLVRDAKLRRAIAVECEMYTQDIDPWGSQEVTSGPRYAVKKINPPAPKVIEQIKKITKQLGKPVYSDDFYKQLNNGAAFAILGRLRKERDALWKTQSCPRFVTDKLEALGVYETPPNFFDGLKLLHKLEKKHARENANQ